jgi:hypothetical protein
MTERSSRLQELPFVSVVMPVRNEAPHIARTLRALLAGDYPTQRMEVLVVDGCSTDETAEIVEAVAEADRRVQRLENPAGSAAAGLNIGVAAARGSVIVRMDGHVIPAGDYVTRCVDALERTGAAAVGGRMVGRGETDFGRAVAAAQATRLGSGGARYRIGGEGPVDTVYLGAWRRETLLALGGFDETLPRNQDYELCVRVRAAGGQVWLDPAIRSETITRGTVPGLARQYFHYGEGRAGTTVRHPRSLRGRQAAPPALMALLVGSRALGRRVPVLGRIGAVAAGAYAVAVGAASLRAASRMRDRGEASGAAWLPTVFLIMHNSWAAGFWWGLIGELAARARRPRVRRENRARRESGDRRHAVGWRQNQPRSRVRVRRDASDADAGAGIESGGLT